MKILVSKKGAGFITVSGKLCKLPCPADKKVLNLPSVKTFLASGLFAVEDSEAVGEFEPVEDSKAVEDSKQVDKSSKKKGRPSKVKNGKGK